MARIVSLFASLTLGVSIASAHPGHGAATSESANSWMHYVTEPLHLIPLLLIVGASVACITYARGKMERREVSNSQVS